MYENYIKELKPKPKFNLTWYKNDDRYDEGDIEDVIVQLIAENEPENYVDAIANNFAWSTFYHLTHMRANILNWYPFKTDASVLEIGCGLGAITGLLCDRCKKVTAVELSKRRAAGALLRCREKANLEVIVGNLNDIEFEEKFDYITLIGVLEYQGKYTDTDNPYCDFLRKVKSLLKPDGKLLIAIENQYGLKYWCGAGEDHTGIVFDGMNQYRLSDRGIRTFSREGLDGLVKESGFKQTFFYYPLPDYKLPMVVYSDECYPDHLKQSDVSFYYSVGKDTLMAKEMPLFNDILQNHVLHFFANSFLVECSDVEDIGEVLFAKMNHSRLHEYQVATRIKRDNTVEKIALNDMAYTHLQQILDNSEILKSTGINIIDYYVKDDILVSDMVTELSVNDKLLELYNNEDIEGIFNIFDKIYDDIMKSSSTINWEENIIYTMDASAERNEEKYGPILKCGYIDMISKNAFLKNGSLLWFDQEWKLESVPAKYVMYRNLIQFYVDYPELEKKVSILEFVMRYKLDTCWKELCRLESLFIEIVSDKLHDTEYRVFRA